MSTRAPGRYPAQGTSEIGDAIRERRGARGLTPLDGTLLHIPAVAGGWNKLLGAVRTAGKLPADVRETMICRVAAHNSASFEWIHHEPVGRAGGLTTDQCTYIRNIIAPTPSTSPLTSLQQAALAFADASTTTIKIPTPVYANLQAELEPLAAKEGIESVDLMVEAMAVTATYHMVSRFLVGLDVDGRMDEFVPFPSEVVTIPTTTNGSKSTISLNTIHIPASVPKEQAKTLIFVNSLMTNVSMWYPTLPYFLASGEYEIILFDQRGHGKSEIPEIPVTVEIAADDIKGLLTHFGVEKAEAVIGVSQGGATTLAFANKYASSTKKIIACDTQAASPAANAQAWTDRVALAKEKTMQALSDVTVPRWFPSAKGDEGYLKVVGAMVTNTPIAGFEQSCAALKSYNLLPELYTSLSTLPTLLVAGSKDGALPGVLLKLAEEATAKGAKDVSFAAVEGSGHLPMVDQGEVFAKIALEFLSKA